MAGLGLLGPDAAGGLVETVACLPGRPPHLPGTLHDEAGDPYSARSGASLRRFRELLSDLDDGFDEPADDVGHLELHDLRHLALYARP